MPTPTVSIIICTRNRVHSLVQTLDSVGRCELPPDLQADFLVVDNGSTDDTANVVRDARLPNGLAVEYLLESDPGLSRARNAGLRRAQGDFYLFTDDDVRVPPNWIGGMCKLLLAGEADAVAGGVHFPPEYEPKLSQEPFRSRRGWLATTERTDPQDPGCLVGANMAFSRRVLEAAGEFDPELGAGALGFCEETLFAFQIMAAGLRIRTAFEVSVAHHFDLARITPEALLNMAARMGRSAAYTDYHWKHQDASGARSKARAAAAYLFLERCKRRVVGGSVLPEAQRVQNFSYWQKLAQLSGQPHRYRS